MLPVAGSVARLTLGAVSNAEQDVLPLRRFLAEREWPQRITTYDMYGGAGLTVMLQPSPTPEQLRELHEEFGDAYTFDTVATMYE